MGPAPTRPFHCVSCRRPYPETGNPHRCPSCGGIYDFAEPLRYEPDAPSAGEPRRGLDRYRRAFPLGQADPFLTLGEGGTPLIEVDVGGKGVHFKCEQLNPTGSFKDRGMAVLVSALAAEGVTAAVEDSSGNAGASFAAYSARAGIEAHVFVPDYASGPKRDQIEAYGAQVVRILGPRSAASEAVLKEAKQGAIYASHAYLPHGLAGMATMAFELCEQLGEAPGSLVVPVGQGTLFLGAYRGFQALRAQEIIERLPTMVAVQAMACAPIWAVQSGGQTGLLWTKERETVAEGIRIMRPHRGDEILAAIEDTKGWAVAVEEREILDGREELSRRGLFVEPTSAVVWPALRSALSILPDPVVAVLTGSGYKDPRDP